MANSENVGGVSPHAIVRITVEKLFGQFTYELPMHDDPADVSTLFLLYGDNGSGKTTILNMLFRLLSCLDGRGYKNYLTKIIFRRFRVELAGGMAVDASRPDGRLEGPYTATILRGEEVLERVDFPNPLSESEEERAKRIRHFLDILDGLGLGLHLLPDNRRIQGGIADDPRLAIQRVAYWHGRSSEITHTFEPTDPEEAVEREELKRAVSRAAQWIRQQAYKGSNTGQKNVNAMYTDIARSIAASPTDTTDDMHTKVGVLAGKLEDLARKSEAFAKFGLISELRVEKMNGALVSMLSPDGVRIMFNVMSPYVRSIEEQLNALENIHGVLSAFVNNLNRFFAGSKTVGYDLRKGFTVRSNTGNRLDLDVLSSGEKHLLFLMCNTIVARDKASILIIDEPEISLNIKWQRRLIRALLDCIRGSNVQLVFATHSIELLAQHKDQVIRLENLEGQVAHGASKAGSNGRRAEDHPRVDSEV